jgi:hypothetical protein
MQADDVMRKYDWNPWYHEIQSWAMQFVDDERAALNAAQTPDTHIVFRRVFQEQIPEFIQQGMSFLPIQEVQDYPVRWPNPGSVRTVIERPTLVNVDEWHRIDNSDNPNNRYMVSFRFKDNPSLEDVHLHLNPS